MWVAIDQKAVFRNPRLWIAKQKMKEMIFGIVMSNAV